MVSIDHAGPVVAGLLQHGALGIDEDAAAHPDRAGAVHAHREGLVDDGVGPGQHELLRAVGGCGLDDVEHGLRAHPAEMAGDLGEPGVVADREAEAPDAVDVEDDEAVARVVWLVRPPREDLAVARDQFAGRGEDEGRVEEFAVRSELAHAAGDEPDAGLPGDRAECGYEWPVERCCRVAQERVAPLRRFLFRSEEMQLRVHHEADAFVVGHYPSEIGSEGVEWRTDGQRLCLHCGYTNVPRHFRSFSGRLCPRGIK